MVKTKMPSTPIAPHFFPGSLSLLYFQLIYHFTPTPSGTVGRVIRTVISTGQLLPAALSSSHLSLSRAWVFPRLCPMLQSGLHGLLGCTLVSLPGAWSSSFSYLSIIGLVLTLFSSLLTAVQRFALSQVSSCSSAVTVPRGSAVPCGGGWRCL